MMRVGIAVITVVCAAAWVAAAGSSMRAGTVRTPKGDVEIMEVYHDDFAGPVNPKFERPNPEPRIVNGTDVPHMRKFPQVVIHLVYETASQIGIYQCTGTLVDKNIVLTAAHCITELPGPTWAHVICAGTVDVYTDTTYRKCFAVSEAYIPAGYDDDAGHLGFDIGVMKTAGSLLGPRIKRAKLNFNKPPSEAQAFMVGFGRTDVSALDSVGTMRYANAHVVLPENCEFLGELWLWWNSKLICGRGYSADVIAIPCNGDSGGPLLVKKRRAKDHVVVGVLSFGPKNCGEHWVTETAYSSLHNLQHKRIIKYLIEDVFGGTWLRGKFTNPPPTPPRSRLYA